MSESDELNHILNQAIKRQKVWAWVFSRYD